MSVPATDPCYTDSISCSSNGSSSFMYGAPDTYRMEGVAGFQDIRMDGRTGQTYNPRNSMAYNSAKGLLNPVGENNCFLNCAVQVLWHLDVFRRNFRLLSGHACLGSSCIFCALKAVFTQYQFSERPALPADSLRRALAHTFADQQRFQMGLMDDASECFENILMSIHSHLAPDETGDDCRAPHCLPHQKFTMKIKEQVKCGCRTTSGELTFDQMVHFVATTSLMSAVQHSRLQKIEGRKVSFGQLLKDAKGDGETRKCSSNCGRLASIHRTLTNSPEVMSIGFVWDSERPSFEHIRGVVNAISTELQPQDLFDSVSESHLRSNSTLKLVGVVCYYSKHYSTFFFHSKMKIWVLFDDTNVHEMGPNWRAVADRCCQGHYQPLLLLYAKENGCPIDTTMALKATVVQRKPEYEQCYQATQHRYVPDQQGGVPRVLTRCQSDTCQSPDFNFLHKTHSTSTLGSLSSEPTGGRQVVERRRRYDSKTDMNHGSSSSDRQPSYLYAITGTNSLFRDEAYVSYRQAIDDAYGRAGSVSSSMDLSVNKTGRNECQTEENSGDSSPVIQNNAKPKSVRFSNRVLGVLPGGRVESFRMSGETGRMGMANDSRYRILPHASYEQSPRMPYPGVNSNSNTQINNPRPSTSSSGPMIKPPPAAYVPVAAFEGESTGTYIAGKQSSGRGSSNADWLGRIAEEEESGSEQYISAKKVQNVLLSQGMKGRRCGPRTNDSRFAGSQNTLTRNSSGIHKVIAPAQNASIHSSSGNVAKIVQSNGTNQRGQVLSDSLENVSLGSHKDSGYRSGDSNADQTSSSSVPSSPSLDSGEFLPARNFQLIARDAMKVEKQDCSEEGSGFSSSLESLSSYASSQGSGIPRRQRAQVLNTIHEVTGSTGNCVNAASMLNSEYKHKEIQQGNFQVSDAAWLINESDRLGKKARKLMSMQENGQALDCIARAKSLLDQIPRSGKSESELMRISVRHGELTSWQNRLLSTAERKSNSSTISCDGVSVGSQSSSKWSEDQERLSSTLENGPLSTFRDGQFQRYGTGQTHSSAVSIQGNKMPPVTVSSRAANHFESKLEIADFNRISKQEPVSSVSRSRDTNYSNNGQHDGSIASNHSELLTSQLFENGATVVHRDKKPPQRQPTKEEVNDMVSRRFSPEYADFYSAAGTKL